MAQGNKIPRLFRGRDAGDLRHRKCITLFQRGRFTPGLCCDHFKRRGLDLNFSRRDRFADGFRFRADVDHARPTGIIKMGERQGHTGRKRSESQPRTGEAPGKMSLPILPTKFVIETICVRVGGANPAAGDS